MGELGGRDRKREAVAGRSPASYEHTCEILRKPKDSQKTVFLPVFEMVTYQNLFIGLAFAQLQMTERSA